MQLKVGGKFHLKLNIGERPIANQYREGKMKSTLERELTVLKLLKGKRLKSDVHAEIKQPLGCRIFCCAGQHRFLGADKDFGNVATSVVFSPLFDTSLGIEERLKDVGVMALNDPS